MAAGSPLLPSYLLQRAEVVFLWPGRNRRARLHVPVSVFPDTVLKLARRIPAPSRSVSAGLWRVSAQQAIRPRTVEPVWTLTSGETPTLFPLEGETWKWRQARRRHMTSGVRQCGALLRVRSAVICSHLFLGVCFVPVNTVTGEIIPPLFSAPPWAAPTPPTALGTAGRTF